MTGVIPKYVSKTASKDIIIIMQTLLEDNFIYFHVIFSWQQMPFPEHCSSGEGFEIGPQGVLKG